MSKIKAAIESAKKNRYAANSHLSTPARASSAPAVNRISSSVCEEPINSNIRRVDIDLEIFRANRILTHNEPHPAEGAYRMLRTRLTQTMRSNGWRILGISSINEDEGKTFSAINLAISIAAEIGQYAVLVDLDLRRPSIHSCLGVDAGEFTCLTQYLAGNVQDLGDLIVCPGIDRLGCLLAATPLPRSSDVLASPHGTRLFDELRQQLAPGTIVVVDLPPIYGADDALAVAPMLDGILLVVAEGDTKRSDLSEARHLVQEYNVIGTVLNKSVEKDSKRTHYYY